MSTSAFETNRTNTTPLPRVTLGRTGLSVSRLALGTVELGVDYGIPAPGHFGKPSVAEAIRLVHSAIDSGINFIDTARGYGTSEEVLGQALAGRWSDVVLATKVSTQLPDQKLDGPAMRKQMQNGLETSLRQLGTETIDIWQIHNVDQPTLDQIDIVAQVFDDARRAGKIRFTGGSFYGTELPIQALAHDVFDVMQVTYSVLDQRIADQLLPLAAENGVGVLVRSILLKGALTERAEHLPPHLHRLRDASRQFRNLVANTLPNATAPQAAIAFGLAHPHIHSILIGVRTPEEIAENVQAAQLELPTQFIEAGRALALDDADLLNPATWGIP